MQQQNYWTGGWAQPPTQMQQLPGTQALKNTGGSYSPLHALADVLGALWQKNSYEGALDYVGGDFKNQLESISTQAEIPGTMQQPQAQQQPVNILDNKQSFFPMEQQQVQPQTRAKTLDEYSKELKGLIPTSAKALMSKYGINAMQQVMPLLESEINDRIASYGRETLKGKRDELNALVQGGGMNEWQNKAKAYELYQDIMGLQKRLGEGDLDANTFAQMVANNNIKLSPIDVGNGTYMAATPANGGTFDMGEGQQAAYQNAGFLPKGLTPGQVQQGQQFNATMEQNERHYQQDYALKSYEVEQRVTTARAKVEAELKANGGKMSQQTMQNLRELYTQAAMNMRNWESTYGKEIGNENAVNPYLAEMQVYQRLLAEASGISDVVGSGGQVQGESQGKLGGYSEQDIIDTISDGMYHKGLTEAQARKKLQSLGADEETINKLISSAHAKGKG